MPTRSRGLFTATVATNRPLCREHFSLILALPEFPPTAAGQFVQLMCSEADAGDLVDTEWNPGEKPPVFCDELAKPQAVLRRPFSLAGRKDVAGGVELEIIHRVVGIGTQWLSELKIGDEVGVLGPLGNQFTPPPADGSAIFVGGGVGIPPMLYLADQWANQPAVAFAGALTRDLLPMRLTQAASASAEPLACVGEFADCGIESVIATDDGSEGYRGYVTAALEMYLDQHLPKRAARFRKPTIYTCGPELMMKRVAAIALERGLPCQVAVERAMACGMGTCQSCCIRVKKADASLPPLVGQDWCYRLACTDGPVFQAADLLW